MLYLKAIVKSNFKTICNRASKKAECPIILGVDKTKDAFIIITRIRRGTITSNHATKLF
jgi:hypothetical protein